MTLQKQNQRPVKVNVNDKIKIKVNDPTLANDGLGWGTRAFPLAANAA
jgi:hypothetical protein